MGVRRLATVADADGVVIEQVENPRPLDAALRELRHLCRARSRCTKGSRPYRQRSTEISRLYRRVNNVRTHHVHGLTTRLAKTHGRVVVEGLDAAGMRRQKGLPGARARPRGLSDAAPGTPRRHLSHKTGWYGSAHGADRKTGAGPAGGREARKGRSPRLPNNPETGCESRHHSRSPTRNGVCGPPTGAPLWDTQKHRRPCMHAERFRPLVTAKGPLASVYFDDSHETEDAAAQRDLKWRAVRGQLKEQGADTAVISEIERTLHSSAPPVGRGGRGVIAGADGVIVNEQLIRPLSAPIVRWSELPYIVPIVEHGVEHHNYLVVAVDHAGADITVHQGELARSETVDGEGYPTHHAHSADSPAYGDPPADRARTSAQKYPGRQRTAERAGRRDRRGGRLRDWRGPLAHGPDRRPP